jgi:hypothetical protein
LTRGDVSAEVEFFAPIGFRKAVEIRFSAPIGLRKAVEIRVSAPIGLRKAGRKAGSNIGKWTIFKFQKGA